MTAHPIEDEDYRGRLDLGVWRRIVRHARPYRGDLAGLAVSGLAVAGLDVGLPIITGRLIDEAVTHGLTPRILWYGAGYAGVIVGFVLFVWWFIVLAGRAATGIACDLRRSAFAQLQDLSFSYFDTRPVGWLVTRLTSDCAKISSLLPWFMLDLFWGTALIAGIVAAMFWLDTRLALVVLTIVPPLALASVFFQRRLLASSRAMRRTNSQMTSSFNECIMGARTTKALVRESRNLDEFRVQSSEMFAHSMRNALESAVFLPLVLAIGSAGVGLALWRGGVRLGPGPGEASVGTLVAFMQFAALFSMPIQELARRFTELQSAQAAAERVQGLLDTEPEIRDDPDVAAAVAAVAAGASSAPVTAIDGGDARIETIEFRDVSFWYKADEPVLRDFDLRVRAGETVALVGPTGGGKSTIVSVLARFYEPRRGAVLVNGIDYRRRSLAWLQSSLGVVLQTPHLFSGTIRENIRYGCLDATESEIEAAARTVRAHDVVLGLEHGYDTEVGEGGGNLSTGERQLVALARAVLADPQIFILDEATSSVDTETERRIEDGIRAVLDGRIAFVIAHRLSTVRSADCILVIEGGRIAEAGTHGELLARRGAYHRLYTRHFAQDRESAAYGASS